MMEIPRPEHSRILIPVNEDGKRYIKADENQNLQADEDDPVLVQKDQYGNWEPVTSIDGPIHRKEFTENYGLWKDQHVLEEQELPSADVEIVRLKNGIIEEDEVEPFTHFQEVEEGQYLCGTEMAINHNENGTISYAYTHSVVYERQDPDKELAEEEVDKVVNIFSNSSQWQVEEPPPPPPEPVKEKKNDPPPFYY